MAEEIHIHDVLIIGAGPCGLALAARLCESTPSALFTDSEHQKFHFLRRAQDPSGYNLKKNRKPIRTSRRAHTSLDRLLAGPSIPKSSGIDIAVLDKSGNEWMTVWNRLFGALKIEHLRSPMFFHADPGDRDALRGFVWREGRERELREIEGVVGRELSKWQRKKKQKGRHGKQVQENTYLDERDRYDYFRPTQNLFRGHCKEIADRYGISDLVEQSEVHSVSYNSEAGVFTTRTSTGTRMSRIVVLATGASTLPSIPPDSPFHGLETHNTVKHVFSPNSPTLPNPLLNKLKQDPVPSTSLAIIGGGLTSAQLASLAAEKGVAKIHLILRGKLKVKHFDVDLCWLAKYKNESMSRFWMADEEEEKWEIISQARGGGSVNPEFRDRVASLVRMGRVVLWEDMSVKNPVWMDQGRWKLELEEKMGGTECKKSEIEVDAVVYATGSAVNFSGIEAIQPLLKECPIQTVAGLPCVTKELMWSEEVPFFVTGRLGGLRLGPAAPNLEGARIGAELIAGRIFDLLATQSEIGAWNEVYNQVDARSLGLGIGNSFEVLSTNGEKGEEISGGDLRAML